MIKLGIFVPIIVILTARQVTFANTSESLKLSQRRKVMMDQILERNKERTYKSSERASEQKKDPAYKMYLSLRTTDCAKRRATIGNELVLRYTASIAFEKMYAQELATIPVSDISGESKCAIEKAISAGLNKGLFQTDWILLCGRLQIRSLIPVFKRQAIIQGNSSEAFYRRWDLLRACGRMGDAESIQTCMDMFENTSKTARIKYERLMIQLVYIRDQQVYNYLRAKIYCDDLAYIISSYPLPGQKPKVIEKITIAYCAARALGKMVGIADHLLYQNSRTEYIDMIRNKVKDDCTSIFIKSPLSESFNF